MVITLFNRGSTISLTSIQTQSMKLSVKNLNILTWNLGSYYILYFKLKQNLDHRCGCNIPNFNVAERRATSGKRKCRDPSHLFSGVFLVAKALDAFIKCLFFELWAVVLQLWLLKRDTCFQISTSHVVCLQVWLVDRVVDIGRTACQWSACPHGIGMQGLRSSCRLGTKLRVVDFDGVDLKTYVKLFGKSGIKTWQNYSTIGQTYQNARTHNKAIGYKRNVHICLRITRVSSFSCWHPRLAV